MRDEFENEINQDNDKKKKHGNQNNEDQIWYRIK
jgi:hypothetical protein